VDVVRGGKIVPELKDIFKLITEHNAVLGTAHISPEEAFVVAEAARDAGAKESGGNTSGMVDCGNEPGGSEADL